MISTGTPYLDPCVAAWRLEVSSAVKRRISGVLLLAVARPSKKSSPTWISWQPSSLMRSPGEPRRDLSRPFAEQTSEARRPWRSLTLLSTPISIVASSPTSPPAGSSKKRSVCCLRAPCGTGKSHIAQALGHSAVRAGYDVLFTSVFRDARSAQRSASNEQL